MGRCPQLKPQGDGGGAVLRTIREARGFQLYSDKPLRRLCSHSQEAWWGAAVGHRGETWSLQTLPKEASTSVFRAGATMSPFSRKLDLTAHTRGPGGLQDGHGGPGALMEKGVELQHVC